MGILTDYENADAVNAALNKGVEANNSVSELKEDLAELGNGYSLSNLVFENKAFDTNTNQFSDSTYWKTCLTKLDKDIYIKLKDNTTLTVFSGRMVNDTFVYNRNLSLGVGYLTAITGGNALLKKDMAEIYVVIAIRNGWSDISNIPASNLASVFVKSEILQVIDNNMINSYGENYPVDFSFGDVISSNSIITVNKSQSRLRTNKIKAVCDLHIGITNGYSCRWTMENELGVEQGNQTWETNDFVISKSNNYYRLCVKKNDGSDFSEDELVNFDKVTVKVKTADENSVAIGQLANDVNESKKEISDIKSDVFSIKAASGDFINLKDSVNSSLISCKVTSDSGETDTLIINSKNMIKVDDKVVYGIHISTNEKGQLVVKGTSTNIINATITSNIESVPNGVKYHVHSPHFTDKKGYFYIRTTNSSAWISGDRVIDLTNDTFSAIKLYVPAAGIVLDEAIDLQLEVGEAFTGFVPYKHTEKSIATNIDVSDETIYTYSGGTNLWSLSGNEISLDYYSKPNGGEDVPKSKVPEYVTTEIQRIVSAVSPLQNSDTFSFAFITDLHHSITGVNHALYALEKISKEVRLEAIVLGGDYIMTNTTKSVVLGEYQDLKNSLNNVSTNCPVIAIKGNHDDNTVSNAYTESIQNSELFSIFYSLFQKDIVRNPEDRDGLYGYYDLPLYKTRMIFLNTHDFVFTNNDGVPSQKSNNYPVFSDEQQTWFSAVLDDVPNGWSVITFGHAIIVSDNLHSLYPNISTNIYNTLKSKADIGNITPIMHVCGHLHADLSEKFDGFNTVVTTAAWSSTNQGASSDGNVYSAVANTAEETAFDIYTVNLATRTITTTRYGYGMKARTFTY